MRRRQYVHLSPSFGIKEQKGRSSGLQYKKMKHSKSVEPLLRNCHLNMKLKWPRLCDWQPTGSLWRRRFRLKCKGARGGGQILKLQAIVPPRYLKKNYFVTGRLQRTSTNALSENFFCVSLIWWMVAKPQNCDFPLQVAEEMLDRG